MVNIMRDGKWVKGFKKSEDGLGSITEVRSSLEWNVAEWWISVGTGSYAEATTVIHLENTIFPKYIYTIFGWICEFLMLKTNPIE